MKLGSLFSGIGGIELGLERSGFELAWQVEFNPFCQSILGNAVVPEVSEFIGLCNFHDPRINEGVCIE